jgi:TorA maturation chaperone TorD
MILMIASANALFSEGLSETLRQFPDIEVLVSKPSAALVCIQENRPDVVLVDEKMPVDLFMGILDIARRQRKSRLILLNAEENTYVLLQSVKATFHSIDDLIRAIHSGLDDSSIGETLEFSRQVEEASARAGMFNFLAGLFNDCPNVRFVERLRSGATRHTLSVLQNYPISEEILEGLMELSRFLDETGEIPEETLAAEMTADWTRLFRGAHPDFGPLPPYESIYHGQTFNQAAVLKDIRMIYARAGASLDPDWGDRPDYLGLELGFLAFLAEQETCAWEKGDETEAFELSRASEEFMNCHLQGWVEKFCQAALPHAQTSFYRGILRITKGVV